MCSMHALMRAVHYQGRGIAFLSYRRLTYCLPFEAIYDQSARRTPTCTSSPSHYRSCCVISYMVIAQVILYDIDKFLVMYGKRRLMSCGEKAIPIACLVRPHDLSARRSPTCASLPLRRRSIFEYRVNVDFQLALYV